MQVIESVEEMQTVAMQLRFGGYLIGLVPGTVTNLAQSVIVLTYDQVVGDLLTT